ncbi:MAG: hypothetical protein ACI9W6_003102, partial [Motiliproteus sp.]
EKGINLFSEGIACRQAAEGSCNSSTSHILVGRLPQGVLDLISKDLPPPLFLFLKELR